MNKPELQDFFDQTSRKSPWNVTVIAVILFSIVILLAYSVLYSEKREAMSMADPLESMTENVENSL